MTDTNSLTGLGNAVPYFHGREDDNLQEWMDKLEDVFTIRGTDDKSKVSLAKFFLKGPAYHWISERARHGGPNEAITKWEEMKEAMREQFILKQSTYTLRSRLENMSWQPGTGVLLSDYADKYRLLSSRL